MGENLRSVWSHLRQTLTASRSGTNSVPEQERRRVQRVKLRMPIEVHGLNVIFERASTEAISPHGFTIAGDSTPVRPQAGRKLEIVFPHASGNIRIPAQVIRSTPGSDGVVACDIDLPACAKDDLNAFRKLISQEIRNGINQLQGY